MKNLSILRFTRLNQPCIFFAVALCSESPLSVSYQRQLTICKVDPHPTNVKGNEFATPSMKSHLIRCAYSTIEDKRTNALNCYLIDKGSLKLTLRWVIAYTDLKYAISLMCIICSILIRVLMQLIAGITFVKATLQNSTFILI